MLVSFTIQRETIVTFKLSSNCLFWTPSFTMVKTKLFRIYSVISWDFQRWTKFPFLTQFKTADILRRNHWIPCEWPLNDCRNSIRMKYHYTGLSSSLWLVEANFPSGTTNQKHDPDLCSNTSSVWRNLSALLRLYFVGKPVVDGIEKFRLFSG